MGFTGYRETYRGRIAKPRPSDLVCYLSIFPFSSHMDDFKFMLTMVRFDLECMKGSVMDAMSGKGPLTSVIASDCSYATCVKKRLFKELLASNCRGC